MCTNYWHVKLGGLKFNGAAAKIIPYAIVDSAAAEPTMDEKFMAACQVCRPPLFGFGNLLPMCLVSQRTGCLPVQRVFRSGDSWELLSTPEGLCA